MQASEEAEDMEVEKLEYESSELIVRAADTAAGTGSAAHHPHHESLEKSFESVLFWRLARAVGTSLYGPVIKCLEHNM